MNISKVAVLGAGGRMGSLTGGLIAQNQLEVYFLSRTDESALKGVKRAIEQARSESIKKFI